MSVINSAPKFMQTCSKTGKCLQYAAAGCDIKVTELQRDNGMIVFVNYLLGVIYCKHDYFTGCILKPFKNILWRPTYTMTIIMLILFTPTVDEVVPDAIIAQDSGLLVQVMAYALIVLFGVLVLGTLIFRDGLTIVSVWKYIVLFTILQAKSCAADQAFSVYKDCKGGRPDYYFCSSNGINATWQPCSSVCFPDMRDGFSQICNTLCWDFRVKFGNQLPDPCETCNIAANTGRTREEKATCVPAWFIAAAIISVSTVLVLVGWAIYQQRQIKLLNKSKKTADKYIEELEEKIEKPQRSKEHNNLVNGEEEDALTVNDYYADEKTTPKSGGPDHCLREPNAESARPASHVPYKAPNGRDRHYSNRTTPSKSFGP